MHPGSDISARLRTASVEDIGDVLAARAPSGAERDEPFIESAVALVLHAGDAGPEALFIKRATRADDPWSGQIALPGGRRHEGERSLLSTAMRETAEEIGLDLARCGLLLGELDELRPRNPLLPPIIVRPYVFSIPERAELVLNEEVAEAFWVPLSEVFNPARRQEVTIEVRGIRLRRPAIAFGEHQIWGMTEHILGTFEALWR